MNTTQSDLVEWYKLETEFFQDHARHTKYVEKEKNRYVRKKDNWSNYEELGAGALSVIYKQVRGTTGRYPAVKMIGKRRLPPNFDYSRELLVGALLAKVCLLDPKGFAPVYYPSKIFFLWSNDWLF